MESKESHCILQLTFLWRILNVRILKPSSFSSPKHSMVNSPTCFPPESGQYW